MWKDVPGECGGEVSDECGEKCWVNVEGTSSLFPVHSTSWGNWIGPIG